VLVLYPDEGGWFSWLRTPGPEVLQVQRQCGQVSLLHQHARGVRPAQSLARDLRHHPLHLRAQPARRVLAENLHGEGWNVIVSRAVVLHCAVTVNFNDKQIS